MSKIISSSSLLRLNGCKINDCSHFRWMVDLEGAPGTLYEGQKYQLQFKFGNRYPFDSPQVKYCFLLSFRYLDLETDVRYSGSCRVISPLLAVNVQLPCADLGSAEGTPPSLGHFFQFHAFFEN